ncbi:MAG: ABC transporter substrate-binding protein [Actinomycetota bacterium]
MRRFRTIGAIVAVVALLMPACGGGGGEAGPSGSAAQGGVLRIGSSSKIDSLNPFKAVQTDAYITFFYIYPVLVQYDRNLDAVPDFATSWDVASDGRSITFHTAEGGTWSDGTPLTAADAAYTINLILKYPGPTSMMGGYAKHIASVEAPDANTLVVRYDAPVNTDWALSQLNQIYVLPQHVWSKHEGNDGKDLKLFSNDAPVVSGGPFVLDAYTKGDFGRFTLNPGFYGQKPSIDGFGIKWFTNDDAMVTALLNGELDMITSVPAQAIDKISANKDMVIGESPGMEWYDLIFNCHKPLHGELLNPKVRIALAHAIDTQRMVDTIWLGHAERGSTIVPPGTPKWRDPGLSPVSYDPALAGRMLDDLGYAKGPDGIRVANGHPMEYDIVTPDITGSDRIFDVIEQGLADIGVRVHEKAMDTDAAWSAIAGKDYTSYDTFDMAIWDWFPVLDPDFILSVLTCDQLGGWSDTGFCDKRYDELYGEQGKAVKTNDRLQLVYQMQRIAYEQMPYDVLYYVNQIEAHTSSWAGFVPSPLGSFNSASKLTLLSVHQVG